MSVGFVRFGLKYCTAVTRLSGQLNRIAIGRKIFLFKQEFASLAMHAREAVSIQPHCI